MRFLVIRCGALGDLVYATSIIEAIKKEYGDNSIINFVCTPGSGKLFEKDSRVNRVFPLKHKKIPLWLSSQKKEVVNSSKKEPYDYVINFEYGKQFQDLFKAVKAKNKIDIKDIHIPTDKKHQVEKIKCVYKDIVSKDVYESSYPKVVGVDKDIVKEKFSLSDNYFVISPSNSHQKRSILNYRAWVDEKWKELVEKLSKDIEVVLIGGKGEESFFEKLKPYPKNVKDLVGKTSVSELIGVIDGAKGLVSTDTGTAHIASAVNTEVFTLIGPTPAYETGPYKTPFNKVHIISLDLECSPCYKTEVMKKCKDNICMKNITVDMVYSKIKESL